MPEAMARLAQGGIAYPERLRIRQGRLGHLAHRLGAWLAARPAPPLRAPGRLVHDARAQAERLARLGDDEVRAAARRGAQAMRVGRETRSDTALVLGACAEAARRTLDLKPYDVQLAGAWTLVRGEVAEMATGEGKTLTAALAATSMALAGIPVHVITVNEYLARRDAERLTPLFEFFGLAVGLVERELTPAQRSAAYARPVVYCTNNELVFDYLKDRIAVGAASSRLQLQLGRIKDPHARASNTVLRGLHFVIVDEVDSILVDEARTPLVISGSGDASETDDGYDDALELARTLVEHQDYRISTGHRALSLTDAGRGRIEQASASLGPLWRAARRREELVTQALCALHLFKRDQHYVVSDDVVNIVDEYTGRIFEDRAWEQGLHQLIELKEGVPPSVRRTSLARISYQQFFRRYLRVSGMSGTTSEIRAELRAVYHLKVTRIPTNCPVQRHYLGASVFADESTKHRHIADRVMRLREAGRPVLIGTRSIGASRRLSACLDAHGIPHNVLNGRQDDEEASIIAGAGESRRVTVATNMAGRGTDVVLAKPSREAGGLHVIATERHESRRVDRQLFGRAGRQGDPGSCEEMLSLDDELWVVFIPRALRSALARVLRLDTPFATWLVERSFTLAQQRAERAHSRTRRALMKADEQLDDALAFSGGRE